MSDLKALADRLWIHALPLKYRGEHQRQYDDMRRAAAILDHLAAAPDVVLDTRWLRQAGMDAEADWLDTLADLTGEQSDGE